MLGLGLGSNKGGTPLSEPEVLYSEINKFSETTEGWNTSFGAGTLSFIASGLIQFEDTSITNSSFSILKNYTSSDVYTNEPPRIYYKIVYEIPEGGSITKLSYLGVFGTNEYLNEETKGTVVTKTGFVDNPLYSSQYFLLNFACDPAADTGDTLFIKEISFANQNIFS